VNLSLSSDLIGSLAKSLSLSPPMMVLAKLMYESHRAHRTRAKSSPPHQGNELLDRLGADRNEANERFHRQSPDRPSWQVGRLALGECRFYIHNEACEVEFGLKGDAVKSEEALTFSR
jgi:hypothetical protein